MSTQPDNPPKFVICVGAVVLRDDAVLFVRQTYGEGLTGVWTLPWGFVHGIGPGGQPDPPHVAALRETLEEGGVTAEIEGLLGIQNHGDHPVYGPRVYLLFLCRHTAGEPAPDQGGTDRAAYFTLTSLTRWMTRLTNSACGWRAACCAAASPIPPEPGTRTRRTWPSCEARSVAFGAMRVL